MFDKTRERRNVKDTGEWLEIDCNLNKSAGKNT